MDKIGLKMTAKALHSKNAIVNGGRRVCGDEGRRAQRTMVGGERARLVKHVRALDHALYRALRRHGRLRQSLSYGQRHEEGGECA